MITKMLKHSFNLMTLCLAGILLLGLSSCKKEPAGVTDIYFTNVHKGSVSMNEGETFRVKYMVEPYELQETAEIEWTTSKKGVATVKNGRVTAVSVGTAEITATTGSASASFTVKVEIVDVTDFKLPSSVSGYIGAPVKVDVTGIEPEEASVTSITWTMSDESVATCHVDGGDLYVTGVKQGTTKLIGEGLDVKRECSVTVKEYIPVQSVKVTLGKSSIGATSSTSVSLSVLPSNASVKDVRWTVSPSSYAEFDESSMTITAGTNPGTVTITATAVNDNVSGSAELTITPPVPESIKISCPKEFPYGHMSPDGSVSNYPKTMQLTAEIVPVAATGKITWKSYDTSRATVDDNGLVTAKGHGAVLIVAECNGVKARQIIKSFKKSAVKWSTYSHLYTSYCTEKTLCYRPYGGDEFYVSDPAAWYLTEDGSKKASSGFYYYTAGGYYAPKVTTMPSGINVQYLGPDYLSYEVHKAVDDYIVLDMGIGSPVRFHIKSGIKSFTIGDIVTIQAGKTGTISRSTLPKTSTTYTIYANGTTAFDSTYHTSLYGGSNYTCSNANLIYDGWKLKLSSSTPTGTYVITFASQYYESGSPVTFTLVIE